LELAGGLSRGLPCRYITQGPAGRRKIVPLLSRGCSGNSVSAATADGDAPLFDALEDCLAAMGVEERELIWGFLLQRGQS